VLAAWPLPRRANWVDHVNAVPTAAELQAIRRSVLRGRPYGDEPWSHETVQRLGLESTLRPQGRPKKQQTGCWQLFVIPFLCRGFHFFNLGRKEW
jgi:REP-associated tyrosine transposase